MKNRISWPIIFGFLLVSPLAYGIDGNRCSRMMNDGFYKTYQWQGVNNRGPGTTEATRKSGSSKVQTDFTSENTTAVLDPKYSSNVSSSMTQGISSFGDCSLVALKERKEQRNLYITQNYDQIRKQIAEGQGSHLDALAWMSLCEEKMKLNFNSSLQNHYSEIYISSRHPVGQSIDSVINQSETLKKNCFNLSSI